MGPNAPGTKDRRGTGHAKADAFNPKSNGIGVAHPPPCMLCATCLTRHECLTRHTLRMHNTHTCTIN
eukprot:6205121-Amphidinium_carterae.1